MNRILITAVIVALPLVGHAASPDALMLTAPQNTINVGENMVVTVSVASPNQAMNAVSGSITFSGALSVESISTAGSIVNFWTQQPRAAGNRIHFEGIVLNPGYYGPKAKIFTITFTAKRAGSSTIFFDDGAILANDGFGTNILDTLGSTVVVIKQWATAPIADADTDAPTVALSTKPSVLPVIIDYSPAVDKNTPAYLKGKGQPNSLTKIVFKNTIFKSIGERFIDFVRTEKQTLDEVLVKNNQDGTFEYTSNTNLVAGVYNATPFLVDETTNTERPGLGVQLLVKDSKLVRILVVAINVLGLLVPIVGLAVLIYFIPWYSLRRMHLLKRRLGLEEEKIEFTEHKLKHKESSLEKS